MSSDDVAGHGHQRIEELLALQALNGLSDGEQEELDQMRNRAGPCDACDRLQREYREAAAGLAYALPPLKPSPDAERRLLGGALDITQPGGVNAPRSASRGPGRHALPARSGKTGRTARRLVAAVAALTVLFGGAAGGYAFNEARRPEARATAAPSPSGLSAFLVDPGTELVRLPARGSQRITLARQDGSRDAWIIAASLPTPTRDRVYQLWYRDQGSEEMQPSGTFRPDANGTVTSHVAVGPSVRVLAVTVEPRGGSKQPSSEPIAQATVG